MPRPATDPGLPRREVARLMREHAWIEVRRRMLPLDVRQARLEEKRRGPHPEGRGSDWLEARVPELNRTARRLAAQLARARQRVADAVADGTDPGPDWEWLFGADKDTGADGMLAEELKARGLWPCQDWDLGRTAGFLRPSGDEGDLRRTAAGIREVAPFMRRAADGLVSFRLLDNDAGRRELLFRPGAAGAAVSLPGRDPVPYDSVEAALESLAEVSPEIDAPAPVR